MFSFNVDTRANQDYEVRLVDNSAKPGEMPSFSGPPTLTTGAKVLGPDRGGFHTSFVDAKGGPLRLARSTGCSSASGLRTRPRPGRPGQERCESRGWRTRGTRSAGRRKRRNQAHGRGDRIPQGAAKPVARPGNGQKEHLAGDARRRRAKRSGCGKPIKTVWPREFGLQLGPWYASGPCPPEIRWSGNSSRPSGSTLTGSLSWRMAASSPGSARRTPRRPDPTISPVRRHRQGRGLFVVPRRPVPPQGRARRSCGSRCAPIAARPCGCPNGSVSGRTRRWD